MERDRCVELAKQTCHVLAAAAATTSVTTLEELGNQSDDDFYFHFLFLSLFGDDVSESGKRHRPRNSTFFRPRRLPPPPSVRFPWRRLVTLVSAIRGECRKS